MHRVPKVRLAYQEVESPLAGIAHSAIGQTATRGIFVGVQPLWHAQPARDEQAKQPRPAWNLHRETAGIPSRFFVDCAEWPNGKAHALTKLKAVTTPATVSFMPTKRCSQFAQVALFMKAFTGRKHHSTPVNGCRSGGAIGRRGPCLNRPGCARPQARSEAVVPC